MNFIELTLGNHIILHGFDAENKEMLENVVVERPSKKLVAVDRILSVSEKFVLIRYAYDRIVYWEYEESYDSLKIRLC